LGELSVKDILLPAAKIAEDGFPITRHYAARLAASAADLKKFEASRVIFLRPDRQPFRAGELFTQTDLARTYRALAENGADWFYRGSFAERTAVWMKHHGGLLTEDDFRRYEVKPRDRS